MKIKTLVINALVAALYIAVTALVAPFAFYQLQFRISEMFNHLIVFNKKYFFGIVLGVLLANLFFSSLGAYEFVFGLSHSVISLGITLLLSKYIRNKWALMGINTFVFSFNMYFIAWMLKIAAGVPEAFLPLWGILAVEEFTVMFFGMFVMYAIHKRINFSKWI